MNKEIYKSYLKTKEWKAFRILVIDKFKCCQRCSSTNRLEVHHKTYRNLFNETFKDVELLCRSCHKKEHLIIDSKKPKGRKFKKHFSSKVFKNIYAR